MVTSRSAEMVRAECDAGVANYLARVHGDHRSRYLKIGIVSAALTGLGTVIASRQFGFSPAMTGIPIAVGLLGSYAVGLITQDADDAAHVTAFEDVCGSVMADDDTEESEVDGQGDAE
jgi:hypothetical protein